MARVDIKGSTTLGGFPHPRGDGPLQQTKLQELGQISPPAWGWPDKVPVVADAIDDFPTRVGMARHGEIQSFLSL